MQKESDLAGSKTKKTTIPAWPFSPHPWPAEALIVATKCFLPYAPLCFHSDSCFLELAGVDLFSLHLNKF